MKNMEDYGVPIHRVDGHTRRVCYWGGIQYYLPRNLLKKVKELYLKHGGEDLDPCSEFCPDDLALFLEDPESYSKVNIVEASQ